MSLCSKLCVSEKINVRCIKLEGHLFSLELICLWFKSNTLNLNDTYKWHGRRNRGEGGQLPPPPKKNANQTI